MDDFTFIVLAGIVCLVLVLLAIGRWYPGSGADIVGWRPGASYERQMELEAEDLDQMLEAHNERRRRRGEPEQTPEEIEQRVAAGLREQQARVADHAAEQEDLAQMLALSNKRRRRLGEPELTSEELKAQLERERAE